VRRANSYNHAMPIAAPRRVGVAGLLGLLAGALLLIVAPGNPGALRVAGISLLWWYGAVAAPLVAVVLVALVQRGVPGSASRRPAVLTLAVWTSPALLALLASRVFVGGPDAPVLALSALVAPLIAYVAPASGGERRPNIVTALAVGLGAWYVHWANLLLFADVAGLLGLARWVAPVLAMIVALATIELAHAGNAAARGAAARGSEAGSVGARLYRVAIRGGGLTLLYASALGFVGLVAVVGAILVTSPWNAWRQVASRPALTFSDLSPWVTEGRTLARPTALDFTESHRVTALSPATYRVLEPGRFREWELRAGETLSLRAGDRLVLEAGARLRFEAGKRIPGSPASGVAWADPPERGRAAVTAEALGAMVTLVGGALAFMGSRPAPGPATVYVASGLLVALVLSSVSLGVFGAFAAPGLSIGESALAAVFDLPAALLPGLRGRGLGAVGAVVLLVLFAATALALRDALERALREPGRAVSEGAGGRARLVRPIMRMSLVAACVAGLVGGEASRALLTGLGLAASATLASRLADDDPGARLAGSLIGVLAFAGLAILGPRLPTWASVLEAYPALAAIPLAWGALRAWSLVAARR
jgi:hypothetical protein